MAIRNLKIAGGIADSKREKGKARRRRAILQAARELIRETGRLGFSMRALADRAGVSLATPFNLFGSKSQVVVELYQDEVARFVHQIELRASTNPIESLFATVHLSREFLKRDPIVSRAILLVLLTEADTDPQIRAGVVRPRVALLSSLIRHAQQSGAIQANVNAEHLGALIGRIFFSVLIDWAHDEISFKEMEAELNRSLLLLLRGACTPAQVRGLDRLLKRKRPK